ncbi:hypothetical protein NC661_10310 [Aquibacillus koreensis]|uniref:Uncharacterized protein n=1 Tax=Aquibacillus koreensis TaxID=279446 RepID=A0A9X4AJT7_9BACI|nr:hypothetical protein [Aquibacillus koreensis]MCT2538297.1 hypothetical protein [Aquibacillus koreensis]MDC3420760.1 hypothetical protein [Aquibacillus koreensis]
MKLVSTANIEESVLRDFFEGKWDAFEDQQTLKAYGYFVEINEQYKAYFALAPVQASAYWLKSLYIKDGAPSSLPLAIIESSITLAREKKGAHVLIHSHQQALDALLEALQFENQSTPAFAEDIPELPAGKWWKTSVEKPVHVNANGFH